MRDASKTSYSYDTRDQVTGATSTAIAGLTLPYALPAAESYGFDSNGNRNTSQSAPGTFNRVQSDGTYTYLYDNEGNVTRRTVIVGGAVTEYEWDHRNRLLSVTEKVSALGAVTKKTGYTYDAFDQRVAKRLDIDGNGTWDRYEIYVWADGQEVMRIVDSDGVGAQPYRLANRYLWGPGVDQLLSDEQYATGTGFQIGTTAASTLAGTTFWALTDNLGSVRDLVDNAGVIRQHLVFDSFGRRTREVDYNSAGQVIASNSTAAIDTLFGYTGRDWDADTKLQYNRARWYDPAIGRWLSQDPIGFAAGDANLYRYVGNGPTNATDPSGLQERENPLFDRFQRHSLIWRDGLLSKYGPPIRFPLRQRMLTTGELNLCEKVFGNAIDYTQVGVASGGWPGQGGNAVTPFGSIYFPPSDYRADFSNTPAEDWFIHEMVHVWQHQIGVDVFTEGISGSISNRGDYGQMYGYNPSSLRYRKFGSFNIEQQARIVQHYFLGKFHGQFYNVLKPEHMRDAEVCMQGLGFAMIPVVPSEEVFEPYVDDFYGPAIWPSSQKPGPEDEGQVWDDIYNPVR